LQRQHQLTEKVSHLNNADGYLYRSGEALDFH